MIFIQFKKKKPPPKNSNQKTIFFQRNGKTINKKKFSPQSNENGSTSFWKISLTLSCFLTDFPGTDDVDVELMTTYIFF